MIIIPDTVQGYHIEHHKYQGQDGIDTDLPTKIELYFLNNVLGKVFFACVSFCWHIFRLMAQQHFSNSFLCVAADLCSRANVHQVAWSQRCRPAHRRLHSRLDIWRPPLDLFYHELIFRRLLAPMCRSFYRRTLPLGRSRSRDLLVLWPPQPSDIQCAVLSLCLKFN